MRKIALLFLLLVLPALALADFVRDGDTLPGPKSDLRPLRAGDDPNKHQTAADYNALREAANSLRTHTKGCINVMSYGATGEGAVDDTQAFEDALAVLNARARIGTYEYATGAGGGLCVPRGVYLVTRPLLVDQDAVSIQGDSEGGTTLLFRLTSNPATTDALTIGSGGGNGRFFEVRNLMIISNSNWGVSPGFRDGIHVEGGYFGSMTNVQVRGAARYGLRISGTGATSYRQMRMAYNGGAGVRVEVSAGGTEPTTVAFDSLTSHYNKTYGVHVANRSVAVTFKDSIFEFSGYAAAGGTAVDGSGVRVGDAGVDSSAEVFLVNPYFEGNAGWDVETGLGMGSGNVAHYVQILGGRASTLPKPGYGFFYGYWAWGQAVGTALFGYNGGATAETYSFDSTCRFSVLGTSTGQGVTALPIYRSGTGNLDDYTGGIIQWPDGNGHHELRGRYIPRVGGPGSANSLSLTRDGASPTVGTYTRGSVALNYAPTSAQDSLFGWRATATGVGAAATWVPVYTSTKPLDNLVAVAQTGGGSKTPDVNARTTRYMVGDATGFTINQPSNMAAGRVFTVWIYNNVGAAMGTITWAGQYRFAGAAAPASPVSGRGTLVTFICDSTVAYEVSRSVDVSN